MFVENNLIVFTDKRFAANDGPADHHLESPSRPDATNHRGTSSTLPPPQSVVVDDEFLCDPDENNTALGSRALGSRFGEKSESDRLLNSSDRQY